MPKFNIAVVSDMHVGSVYGILPPGFALKYPNNIGDREISLNAGQKYLWECWKHFCAELEKLKIHAIVFLGDCIDGKQAKDEGGELCLPLRSQQAEAAAILARRAITAAKNPTLYVIKGTPYHSGIQGDDEQRFASEIGAGAALEYLDLEVDGVLMNFLHGVGTGFYLSAALDREAMWSALAGKQGRALKADCLIRAHVHRFAHVEFATKHAFINPCWKLQDFHARKNSAYRWLPELGAMVLTIDPDAKREKQDPIAHRKFIYDLPVRKPTKLVLQ